MKHISFLSSLLFSIALFSNANTLKVPADQPSIQKAINAASDGDTVLVSPGTYYENINFNKKRVVLTSHYLFNNDPHFISSTIINGSQPIHRDTASCILIINGQDASTVVQGFTITGGKGTAWKDEHSDGTYREGGGIFVALSSPTIQHNLIIGNEAIDKKGLTGTGGGGIRCGDGSPQLLNNVIVNNTGKYGAGIVLNWCGATIRNNIIAGNVGGEDYGGGGIWINNTNGKVNLIENNTIVNNHSYTTSGGILMYSNDAKATLKNNIVYGNTAKISPQITVGSNVKVTYSNIEGGWKGEGNINKLPIFADSLFYLNPTSPCIDAGDTTRAYNDLPTTTSSVTALFPSQGLERNDMGANGGRFASLFPEFVVTRLGTMATTLSLGNANSVGQTVKQKIVVVNQSSAILSLDSVVVMRNKEQFKLSHPQLTQLQPSQSDTLFLEWTPTKDEQLNDTISLYAKGVDAQLELKIALVAKFKKITGALNLKAEPTFYNYPNPFSTTTTITYALGENYGSRASLTVYNSEGKLVKACQGLQQSGTIAFDGSHLPEGVYLCKLTNKNSLTYINKMLVKH